MVALPITGLRNITKIENLKHKSLSYCMMWIADMNTLCSLNKISLKLSHGKIFSPHSSFFVCGNCHMIKDITLSAFIFWVAKYICIGDDLRDQLLVDMM